ncbi:MAG TPA: tripartite tricarboxylate transporter TctB family protein [Pseudomonas sp.]|nr:tripartite tricarboxylate transporter TctB family protein [Pseudomonas sp.]
MRTIMNNKEAIIGVIMIVCSLAYLVMAYQLPDHDGVDAATLPVLLGGFLTLLGVMQLFSAFTSAASAAPQAAQTPATPQQEAPTPETAPPVVEPRTVLLTLGLILGYMALLGTVGFPIMTVVYLYLQFLVLIPAGHKARHIAYLLIAVSCSAAIFLLFREAFDLMLPAGPLNDFL